MKLNRFWIISGLVIFSAIHLAHAEPSPGAKELTYSIISKEDFINQLNNSFLPPVEKIFKQKGLYSQNVMKKVKALYQPTFEKIADDALNIFADLFSKNMTSEEIAEITNYFKSSSGGQITTCLKNGLPAKLATEYMTSEEKSEFNRISTTEACKKLISLLPEIKNSQPAIIQKITQNHRKEIENVTTQALHIVLEEREKKFN
jgi:hypothetical protein